MAVFYPTRLVPIESIEEHPSNSNVVPEAVLVKIRRNIKRTGIYPPLMVREMKGGTLRMIDGRHRRLILRELGYQEVEVKPVSCSDREELVLLASLNTLRGNEDPRKRALLMGELNQTIRIEELALIVPEDAPQIADSLRLLETSFESLEVVGGGSSGDGEEGPKAKTFLLYADQLEVVSNALAAAIADGNLGRSKNPEGMALEYLCAEYLSGRAARVEEE